MSAEPARFASVRDDLGDLDGYHSPQVEVPVRLNTNESPYPPPPEFVREYTAALAAVAYHRYPDRAARALREATAEFIGVAPDRVFCANGSNEVIQTLLLAYGGPGRRALVFPPTYLLHEHIARITATEVVTAPRNVDFTLDADTVERAVAAERPEITFLCSPNNPTGMVEPREVVRAAVEATTGLVVVDEAYGEFSAWSALELAEEGCPIVVVRTFSKVWSLAAVRLGYCVAPQHVVTDLERVALPYHLAAPTQIAGQLALRFRTEMEERVERIVAERERVARALASVEGMEVLPSGANFLLFLPPGDAAVVWQGLLDRGVLVRDCSSWKGLAGFLRVTVGTPEENDAFIRALDHVCREGDG